MRIKGWEKISGITYKGYCMINPMHNADETTYFADIMDLNTKHTLVMELEMQQPYNVISGGNPFLDTEHFMLHIRDVHNKIRINRILELINIRSLSSFRRIFELCIEDYLKELYKEVVAPAVVTSTPKSSSMSIPSFDEFIQQWQSSVLNKIKYQ